VKVGNMLLTGTYERTLDEKFRFALPKSLRELFSGEKHLVLSLGTDGSLSLYSQHAFQALAEKLAARSPTARDVRSFSRLLYARSQQVEVDPQGRIRVPPDLARLANLTYEMVLIGVGDRVEIWNKQRWEAYLAEQQPRFDELAEAALSERPSRAPLAAPQNGEAVWPVQPRQAT
jgi:MraZ protein